MAHRLTLPSKAALPFIWNVSRHVGDSQRHPNQPADVNLVKYLFTALKSRGYSEPLPPGMLLALPQDGSFDVALGYCITRFQRTLKQPFPDGVVSPAQAAVHTTDTWLIGRLNASLFFMNRRLWENLPDAPGLDPLLSYELRTARL